MALGISTWALARAVGRSGQMGVVSGTALPAVLAYRLQHGDAGGHVRRALAAFPDSELVSGVLDAYYRPARLLPGEQPKLPTPFTVKPSKGMLAITVLANFVEVFLAKEGHDGLVGVNYMEKLQLPSLPSLYGAMLAGVDAVFMGAGIPRFIPQALDGLARHDPVSLPLAVLGTGPQRAELSFYPRELVSGRLEVLRRPLFVPIVASDVLATVLVRKSKGRIDDFVVEGHTAGGHNAPPRGKSAYGPSGEPIYGPRDIPDLSVFRGFGLPFWMAGSWNAPERLREAQQQGASGIQVGSLFALCGQSGLRADLRESLLKRIAARDLEVHSDPRASPTGFPLKVARLAGTLSDSLLYERRSRTCNLGFLRQPVDTGNGQLCYRCPAEPVEAYIRKGGDIESTQGRKCLCNALAASANMALPTDTGGFELPLVTMGGDLESVRRFLRAHGSAGFTVQDLVAYLLSG